MERFVTLTFVANKVIRGIRGVACSNILVFTINIDKHLFPARGMSTWATREAYKQLTNEPRDGKIVPKELGRVGVPCLTLTLGRQQQRRSSSIAKVLSEKLYSVLRRIAYL